MLKKQFLIFSFIFPLILSSSLYCAVPVSPLAQTVQLAKQSTGSEEIYNFPGVATLYEGKWIGSENLYNLDVNIGVNVEVIKPSGISISLNEELLKNLVNNLLKSGRLDPRPSLLPSNPSENISSPLPFLHVLVMVYPIEKGFAAICAVRLFEEVRMERINVDKEFKWQVITWEKQELIIASPEQLNELVGKVVADMVVAFVERFKQDGGGKIQKSFIKKQIEKTPLSEKPAL